MNFAVSLSGFSESSIFDTTVGAGAAAPPPATPCLSRRSASASSLMAFILSSCLLIAPMVLAYMVLYSPWNCSFLASASSLTSAVSWASWSSCSYRSSFFFQILSIKVLALALSDSSALSLSMFSTCISNVCIHLVTAPLFDLRE